MTLTELAIKWNCDKYWAHSYTGFYQELLSQMKITRLCEIGIGYESMMKDFVPRYIHGASLHMWAEALPEAEVFACDIRPETLINEGRIHSMEVDQTKLQDLGEFLSFTNGPCQLTIDDGCHDTSSQIFTAQFFLPILSKGMVYVIEDVSEPDRIVEELGEGIICQFDKRPDDCLVVFGR